MSRLTADPTVQTFLGTLTEPTEIRDSSGRLLGLFTPASHFERDLYQQAARHFDPEETKRRKQSGRIGSTTQEVLAHLKGLERA